MPCISQKGHTKVRSRSQHLLKSQYYRSGMRKLSLKRNRGAVMSIGDIVLIRTQRPHIEQFNGSRGEFVGYLGTRRDIAVVCIGRYSLNFYLDEIEAIAPGAGGDVQR